MLLQFQEASGIQPIALRDKPLLSRTQAYYATCFAEVSRDRRYTEGGPLPLSTGEIRTYWEAFSLPDFDDFYHWMTGIDRIWMAEVSKNSKKA